MQSYLYVLFNAEGPSKPSLWFGKLSSKESRSTHRKRLSFFPGICHGRRQLPNLNMRKIVMEKSSSSSSLRKVEQNGEFKQSHPRKALSKYGKG
jgi:hypothetical protein